MGPASKTRLATCHPDLIRLMEAVDVERPIVVIQGARPPEEEQAAIASGLSHTTHSKHLMTPAMAVDFSPAPYVQNDVEGCKALWSEVIQPKAAALGIAVRWGGDWDGKNDGNPPSALNDLDHVELL